MAACPTNSNRRALDDLRDSEGAATAVIAMSLTPCERKVKMLRNLLHWATDGSPCPPFQLVPRTLRAAQALSACNNCLLSP